MNVGIKNRLIAKAIVQSLAKSFPRYRPSHNQLSMLDIDSSPMLSSEPFEADHAIADKIVSSIITYMHPVGIPPSIWLAQFMLTLRDNYKAEVSIPLPLAIKEHLQTHDLQSVYNVSVAKGVVRQVLAILTALENRGIIQPANSDQKPFISMTRRSTLALSDDGANDLITAVALSESLQLVLQTGEPAVVDHALELITELARYCIVGNVLYSGVIRLICLSERYDDALTILQV